MIVDSRKAEQSLTKKGFKEVNGHHRRFVYHKLNGMTTRVKTYTSHNGQELNDYLIREMAKQCKLPKDKFLDFINCNLSQENYELFLIENFPELF